MVRRTRGPGPDSAGSSERTSRTLLRTLLLTPGRGPRASRRYNRRVSRFYSLDDANALVPDLDRIAGRLRDRRDEIVGVRDAYRAREGVLVGAVIAEVPGTSPSDDPELRRLRLRMRGIVDQMQADVAWLDERSIALRDISTGLLDLPALTSGRPVWLCWRLGEPTVLFWHRQDQGFDSRRSIADLEGTGRTA